MNEPKTVSCDVLVVGAGGRPRRQPANLPERQKDYGDYGQGLRRLFDPSRPEW